MRTAYTMLIIVVTVHTENSTDNINYLIWRVFVYVKIKIVKKVFFTYDMTNTNVYLII